jgi:predicted acylesterase/phospholipase RssA
MKGLAHIGALQALEGRGLLRACREYIGISAGALVAFALCIGYSLQEIQTIGAFLDFGVARNLDPEVMLRFPETFGLDDGENLRKMISALLKVRGLPADLTFAGLAALRTGAPALRLFAADVNACEPREMSLAATPTMELRVALQASMCIPVYYAPVVDPVNGHHLVDGGLINNIPAKMLTEAELEHTLVLAFNDGHKVKDRPLEGLGEFLLQIYFTNYHHQVRDLKRVWGHKIFFLPVPAFHSLHFEATPDEKLELMASGRKAMEEMLGDLRRNRAPVRRFSQP